MNNNCRNGGASRAAVSLCFTLIALALSACGGSLPTHDSQGRIHARVVSVTDGDTITLSVASHRETVRLIGVDTPETKHPTKPVECWGPEASQFTHALLPRGTDVVLVRDEEARDKYGRLLVYLYRAVDNLFVNLELVAGGWAHTLSIPPNTAFESEFATAERQADRSHLGLWAHCLR